MSSVVYVLSEELPILSEPPEEIYREIIFFLSESYDKSMRLFIDSHIADKQETHFPNRKQCYPVVGWQLGYSAFYFLKDFLWC
jgi:hypothetical protein